MDTQQDEKIATQQAGKSEQPHVVIIGAGFGGLQAATHLGDAPVKVTIIDRSNHHLFQPLLYQVATAALSPAEISAPIRHVVRKQKNTSVMMAEVTGVDAQNQRVFIHDQTVSYDYLVIATGAHENYFGHSKEWKELAPGLKTINDATAIRSKLLRAFEAAEIEQDPQRVRELLTFIIVGAGPTGVEMAGAIAEVARKTLASEFRHIDPKMARVMLVEAAPRMLNAFPESLARSAQRELERLGVEVWLKKGVESIEPDGVVIAGEHIAAHTVIWTAGVQASPAGEWLGADTDRAGRVKVEPDLSVPGLHNVFVIGDTATLMQDGKPLPGVAPTAMQQGRYVAALIKQRVVGKHEERPFYYRDKGSLATVGRAYAIMVLGRFRLAGFLAWVLWLTIHIFYLIGFENRVAVMLQWAWAYLTYRRRARLITVAAKHEEGEYKLPEVKTNQSLESTSVQLGKE